MTPLQFATSLATDLTGRQVPKDVHAQLGDVVIDCVGTWVTVLSVTDRDLGGGCGMAEMADVNVVAAIDCAFVALEDGTTDWAKQNTVMAELDRIAAELTDWGRDVVAEGKFANAAFNGVQWQINGGLGIVTMGMLVPVP